LLSRNSSLIAAIWLVILSIKMSRMLFVLGYTRHIMRRKTHRPPMYWQNRLAQLCRDWQIAKTVGLLESTCIKLPVVYGQLKPVILVPLGFLTQLPPAEIESILLHELAHIRRSDYLVNLLQNLIEAIFFFNPGLLWIAELMRDERENCCDDLAIARLKDTRQYVESLIRFRERSMYAHPVAAVGFAGRKNSFINRISRIVDNKNYTLSRFETGSLVCSVVIAALMALFVVTANKTQAMTIHAIAPATPPDRTIVISFAPVATPIAKPAICPRPATSRPAATTGAAPGHPATQTIILPTHPTTPTAHATTLTAHPTTPPARDTTPPAIQDTGLHSYEAVRQRMHQVIADLVKEGVVPDSAAVQSFALDKTVLTVNDQPQPEALHQKLIAIYGIQQKGLYYGEPNIPGHGYFITEGPRLDQLRQKQLRLDQLRQKQLRLEQLQQEKAQAHQEMAEARAARRKEAFPAGWLDAMIANITDDLVAAGVLRNKEDLVSFLLTNRKLAVNGQLQPETLHETLREKYILQKTYTQAFPDIAEDPDFGWHHNAKNGRMGIGIHHWGNALE
jgi:beta-lactamase regulating signal transducer with metallopeptidase domain